METITIGTKYNFAGHIYTVASFDGNYYTLISETAPEDWKKITETFEELNKYTS